VSSPTGRIVGRVGIRVLPNTADFVPALQRYLTRVEQRIQFQVRTGLDTSDAERDFDRLRADIAGYSATLRAGLDDDQARAALRALLAEISASRSDVNVGIDRSRLDSDTAAVLSALGSLGKGALITVGVAGVAAAVADVGALAAALAQAAGTAALIPAALLASAQSGRHSGSGCLVSAMR
jgi:hypothetical protein